MNLLIVDDQPFVIEALKKDLKDMHEITAIFNAMNGEAAKTVITNEKIDILLCDIEMPVCNGLDLLEWANNYEYDLECIFLTSFPDFKYAKKAISLGCLDYVLKPISKETLQDVLNKAISKIQSKKASYADRQYSSLWLAHQPYLIERLWLDLITGRVAPTRDAVKKVMEEINLPGMEGISILPILIDFQNNYDSLSEDRRIATGTVLHSFLNSGKSEKNNFSSLIEFTNSQYFYILYAESGIEEINLPFIEERCRTFSNTCSSVLHIFPNCIIGKKTVSFLLREQTDYLLEISKSIPQDASQIVFYNVWKKEEHIPLPDMNTIRMYMEKQLYENIIEYYNSYFHETTKDHILVSKHLFVMKQDFLQVYSTVFSAKNMNSESIWKKEDIFPIYKNADNSINGFTALIKKMCEIMSARVSAVNNTANIIEQAEEYISNHLTEDISRVDVAEAVNMNADYFAKLFKKKTGLLIYEYILEKRLQLAQGLLKSDIPIIQVAFDCGFNSAAYFSSTFKKYCGQTPLEYRKSKNTANKYN